MKTGSKFAVGQHRPVYLWAGQTTVRMNRLKFMDTPVDELVHEEAHQTIGAKRVAREAYCNWAYLMYDWGFPPEIEKLDWRDFEQAVKEYHDQGINVFGYVQSSNCVYSGSYKDMDWYAHDPKGEPFHYYTGRYMTCWSHPLWLNHLREMIYGVIHAGAEGVFFDNPWHGTDPMHLFRAWMGSAGCYCGRCKSAFRKFSGTEIPTRISPATKESTQIYLRWRAAQVTNTLMELSAYARSLNPDIVISANNYDPVMRPSYLVYGVDLSSLAQIQDVVMIEDFALPNWDGDSLVNNSLTLRTAQALIGDKPLSTIPYDQGIGFDNVYAPRRYQQAIAEAAACGASSVVKGTEYVENGVFTLLTAERYKYQRQAIGQINRWLEEHAKLYAGRINAASIGLMHPGENLYWFWDQLAPLYFGVGQTLLANGIAWKVVSSKESIKDIDFLLSFDEPYFDSGLKNIHIPDLPGWETRPISFLERHPIAHNLASKMVNRLYRAYFENQLFRTLGDKLRITSLYMASPMFKIPNLNDRKTLLTALGNQVYPHVKADSPVLVEIWQRESEFQLHLVNYARTPIRISINFGDQMVGKILSPDHDIRNFQGAQFEIELDVYSIVLWKK